jgi:hypothetical protein
LQVEMVEYRERRNQACIHRFNDTLAKVLKRRDQPAAACTAREHATIGMLEVRSRSTAAAVAGHCL